MSTLQSQNNLKIREGIQIMGENTLRNVYNTWKDVSAFFWEKKSVS